MGAPPMNARKESSPEQTKIGMKSFLSRFSVCCALRVYWIENGEKERVSSRRSALGIRSIAINVLEGNRQLYFVRANTTFVLTW